MNRMGLYLFVIIFTLAVSWEYQHEVSASLIERGTFSTTFSKESFIPEDALRLRVIAHSDHPEEQWLKREVRDAVIGEVLSWVEQVDTVEAAEAELKASLGRLESVVQQTMVSSGFEHSFTIEYGEIFFPTKLYGQQLYPAGQYQGLLITIGAGQGDNWWCVLFPPLCFVDFGTGEVLDPDWEFVLEAEEYGEETAVSEVEVRFFLAELFAKIKAMFV